MSIDVGFSINIYIKLTKQLFYKKKLGFYYQGY